MKKECFVYFIQMEKIGPIKIGITKDARKRLLSLQTGNPYPLRLLCSYPCDANHEKEWHEAFSDVRLEGEWFLPHPDLSDEIERHDKLTNKADNRGLKGGRDD